MKAEKQLLIDEVKEQFEQCGDAYVILRYKGFNANMANAFRGEIAKLGGNFEVVRKRILLKAADSMGVKLDLATLTGHIGLVFSGHDPLETAKAVFRFSQENEQALSVIGGKFEGQYYDGAQIEMLSKLPGRDEMRAQLLATFEAPMAQTLAVMEALLTSIPYCLENKCKQES